MIEVYIVEWLSFSLRFLHIIVGIAWIGASFYFNWLENKLNRAAGQREGIAGHLWAVHGGGFYHLEKYQKYPDELPPVLHWFKWEAYVTWLSGFALLIVIYYFNAQSYLVNNNGAFGATSGIALSVGGLLVAWLFYDALCKLFDGKHILIIVLLALFIGITSYFYFQVFSPRAAVMQIGVMIGTIMVANVFFVIIPVQRELVKACTQKTPVSAELGLKGYTRSRHNNYLTLPVLFVMISSHYPMIYSHAYGWLSLFVVFVISVMIRHYFNLRGVGKKSPLLIVFMVLTTLALVAALAPWQQMRQANQRVSFTQIKQIIEARCVSCHAQTPTDTVFLTAPNGFMLDTEKQIRDAKALIYARTIVAPSMPLANKTQMTDEERKILGAWLVAEMNK